MGKGPGVSKWPSADNHVIKTQARAKWELITMQEREGKWWLLEKIGGRWVKS